MTFAAKAGLIPRILLVLSLLGLLVPSLWGCSRKAVSSQERQMAEMTKRAEMQNQEKWEKEKPKPNHLELARALVDKGLFQVALVQLEQAQDTAGRTCEVYHLTGRCYLGLGQYPRALESFRRALSIDRSYAPSHNGLGLALDLSGSREQAWESYQKAIELNPARADFYSNLGFSKLMAERFQEAEKYLRESLVLNPDLKIAVNNLALCYALQGRFDQAAALLKQYSPPAAASNNLGVLYEINGNRKAALQHYRTALSMDETLPAAQANLGNQGDSRQDRKTAKP
ncbi:tetratricopeptide repeat protein [Desulfobacca acetoxidans]